MKVALGQLSETDSHIAATQRPLLKALVAHFRGDRDAVRREYDSHIRHYWDLEERLAWALRAGDADPALENPDRPVFGLPDIKRRDVADLGLSPSPALLEDVGRAWRMSVRPTGRRGTRVIRSDARVLAATNRDLPAGISSDARRLLLDYD